MTDADAITVLRLRLELTGETYTPATVAAWAQSLDGLQLDEIGPAVHALAGSDTQITIPAIRAWLRDQTATAKRAEAMRSPTFACGCTVFVLCDTHRDRNLEAIHTIRDERGWPKPQEDPCP